MGICIHYSGRIANKQQLPSLIDEVEEIAKAEGWEYEIFERNFPDENPDAERNDEIYGIDFTPEGSESVSFSFLNTGEMSCIMLLALWGNFETESTYETETETFGHDGSYDYDTETTTMDKAFYEKMLRTVSVKTQYAGAQTHAKVIEIMRFISNKYLTDFNLSDEANYWETGSVDELNKNFKKLNFLLDSMAKSLQNADGNGDFMHEIKKAMFDVDEKLRNKDEE